MRPPIPDPLCDYCGETIDTSVQPRVILFDSNIQGSLEFCDYTHLASWATNRHEVHEGMRSTHLAVTIDQLNDTLARAWELEQLAPADKMPEPGDEFTPPVLGEYATVESVPLHPLVELHRTDDGSPYVVAKAAP